MDAVTSGDDTRLSLGAYLLGALEPDERAEVESHLASCPDCRAELAELAGLPGLLARLGPEEAQPVPAEPGSPALDGALAAIARRRRRGRRRWIAGAVAAVLLIGGGAGAAVWLGQPPAVVAEATVSATNPDTGVSATATLDGRAFGTVIELQLRGVEAGQRCLLVAVGERGRREIASTWKAGYSGVIDVPGTTGISPERLAALRVVTADGDRLVTLWP